MMSKVCSSFQKSSHSELIQMKNSEKWESLFLVPSYIIFQKICKREICFILPVVHVSSESKRPYWILKYCTPEYLNFSCEDTWLYILPYPRDGLNEDTNLSWDDSVELEFLLIFTFLLEANSRSTLHTCRHVETSIFSSILPYTSIFYPYGTDNPFSYQLIFFFQHNFLDIPNYNQMEEWRNEPEINFRSFKRNRFIAKINQQNLWG